MTYKEADEKLVGRCARGRKLENNTYLERRDLDSTIAVRLHSTDVITFHSDGRVVLDSGGWWTVTTRDRINRYMPDGWCVWSERGQWLLGHSYSNPICMFEDGVTIHPSGEVTGGWSVAEWREKLRQSDNARNRVRSRARYWLRKARGLYRDRSQCRASYCHCHPRRGFGGRFRPGSQVEGICEDCGCQMYRVVAKPGKLTVENILAERNAQVRMAKVKIFGLGRFALECNPKVLDTHGDYELLQLPSNGWQTEMTVLKMQCPSTQAVYLSPVEPRLRTVSSALDWVFQVEGYLERLAQEA